MAAVIGRKPTDLQAGGAGKGDKNFGPTHRVETIEGNGHTFLGGTLRIPDWMGGSWKIVKLFTSGFCSGIELPCHQLPNHWRNHIQDCPAAKKITQVTRVK